jgi:hypothetical protein
MTTRTEARDAIVAYLDPAWRTAFPSVPIFYENTTQVELDTIGSAFLQAEINYDDSQRLDIDEDPHSQTWGNVSLRLFAKEGTGTRQVLLMQDTIEGLMKYRKLGGLTLDCPTPGKKIPKDGWTSYDIHVPFQYFH